MAAFIAGGRGIQRDDSLAQLAQGNKSSSCYSDGRDYVVCVFEYDYFTPKASSVWQVEICSYGTSVAPNSNNPCYFWIIPVNRSPDSPYARQVSQLLANGKIQEVKMRGASSRAFLFKMYFFAEIFVFFAQ